MSRCELINLEKEFRTKFQVEINLGDASDEEIQKLIDYLMSGWDKGTYEGIEVLRSLARIIKNKQ